MNKTELIAAVAEKASISKKESEVVINAALETIILHISLWYVIIPKA